MHWFVFFGPWALALGDLVLAPWALGPAPQVLATGHWATGDGYLALVLGPWSKSWRWPGPQSLFLVLSLFEDQTHFWHALKTTGTAR